MNIKINLGGFSFLGMLLGTLFLGLKLAHVINWAWWLVLLPFYLPFAITLVLFAVYGILVLISERK